MTTFTRRRQLTPLPPVEDRHLTAPAEDTPPQMTVMEAMIKRNPALKSLVDTLDLYETSWPQLIKSESQEQKQRPPATPERLKSLADMVFPDHGGMTRQEAITVLMQKLALPATRAENGLNQMIEAQVIQCTSTGVYYLANSSPF